MTKSNTARALHLDAKAALSFANILSALADVFTKADKAKDTNKARIGAQLVSKSEKRRILTTGGAAEYAHACRDKAVAVLSKLDGTNPDGSFDALDAMCIDALTERKLRKVDEFATIVIAGHARIKAAALAAETVNA